MELSFNLWASFAYPSYLNADILLDKKQYIMKVMGGAGQGILSGVTRAGQGILSWVTRAGQGILSGVTRAGQGRAFCHESPVTLTFTYSWFPHFFSNQIPGFLKIFQGF